MGHSSLESRCDGFVINGRRDFNRFFRITGIIDEIPMRRELEKIPITKV